ncbi:hypothetical protein F2Q69_00040402 [Brassica cretica]|uniref:Uncharacterized protein n=1 Tax=Brassica cretica TaxID=69181 RepID=A0A8S9N7X8_BRACR|nr:hypothetical protein F2Q69_00040402 [Brassica cretica]
MGATISPSGGGVSNRLAMWRWVSSRLAWDRAGFDFSVMCRFADLRCDDSLGFSLPPCVYCFVSALVTSYLRPF